MAGVEQMEIDLSKYTAEPDLNNLPILATRNLVLFPGMTVSFELAREVSQQVAQKAADNMTPIGVVCQINPEEDNPTFPSGLNRYGTFADVLKIIQRPDSSPVALVRSRGRFRVMGKGSEMSQNDNFLKVKPLGDRKPNEAEFKEVVRQIRETTERALRMGGDPHGLLTSIVNIVSDVDLVHFLATNLPFENEEKVEMLAEPTLMGRAFKLLMQVNLFEERIKLTDEISRRARRSMDENQQNAFLQQQMEAIRERLYGDDAEEIDRLIEKADASLMPAHVLETFHREAEKLRRYNPSSPDYAVQYSYLETLVNLPWGIFKAEHTNLAEAAAILEEDHYGLEKVKDRIIEQLALLMRIPDGKAPIICLVGAPGVGKTSIGRSVAKALKREYGRVSFGGLHDEAEIRGHRRTYIGAMPGRIIDAIKRVKAMDPVLILDEIDKIGADYKGDPSAALLEVLDPEQNCHFHDNYVDVDFDLSHVLFIATANTLSTVPKPLLDRMEIIDISGYLLEEKIEIAKRHLIPRAMKEHNLDESLFELTDDTLKAIISGYTSESGVRGLEKQIAKICRKIVLKLAEEKEIIHNILPEHLYDFLGLAPFQDDSYEGNDLAGVVTGLAWTQVGGAILLAESVATPSKDGRLTVTGNLGDVMKESASIAYEWVKANSSKLGIDPAIFDRNTIHVHFPEGAVPKDGPSAGITIATSIVSLLTQKRVAPRLAMTGEITLRGRVLPIGGVKEKILAAKRAGISQIILPAKNKRDIDDMPEAYVNGLEFHYADTVDQVMEIAITDQPVVNPVKF